MFRGAAGPTPTCPEKTLDIETSSKAAWVSHDVALGVAQQTSWIRAIRGGCFYPLLPNTQGFESFLAEWSCGCGFLLTNSSISSNTTSHARQTCPNLPESAALDSWAPLQDWLRKGPPDHSNMMPLDMSSLEQNQTKLERNRCHVSREKLYTPPLPSFLAKRHFPGEGVGVYILRPHAAGILYAPPFYTPPTP